MFCLDLKPNYKTNHREGDRRIGDEPVGLDAVLQVDHLLLRLLLLFVR